jgi:hypothetical protein
MEIEFKGKKTCELGQEHKKHATNSVVLHPLENSSTGQHSTYNDTQSRLC